MERTAVHVRVRLIFYTYLPEGSLRIGVASEFTVSMHELEAPGGTVKDVVPFGTLTLGPGVNLVASHQARQEPWVSDRSLWSATVRVRPLVKADMPAVAVLYRRVLNSWFLSLWSLAFMRTCYLAWVEAPGSIAIGAVDECGDLVGALLGATDPAVHARAMAGRRRRRTVAWLGAYAVVHPPLAKDLIVIRGYRYGRRVTQLGGRPCPTGSWPGERGGPTVAEVTHLFVRLDRQGSGVGRALVDAAIETARAAGVNQLVLVTPADLMVRNLCERLGWFGEDEDRQRRAFSSSPAPTPPGPGD